MNNSGEPISAGPEEQTATSLASDLVVDTAHLLPGDVLLYRPKKPNIVAQKISDATGSPYTHAAIYIGEGKVAESNFPGGVRTHAVDESIKGCQCVAVLRSQLGFGGERPQKLNALVSAVMQNNRFYNLIAVAGFERTSKAYFDAQLDIVRSNYGKVTLAEEFAQQSFFCSAFVVACYSVVGIIGPTAQVAYLPNAFSPGSLYQDPTFGWLLGYLVPEGGSVPQNDPVLVHATLWRDCQDVRWW
jgi:hypothetical protein